MDLQVRTWGLVAWAITGYIGGTAAMFCCFAVAKKLTGTVRDPFSPFIFTIIGFALGAEHFMELPVAEQVAQGAIAAVVGTILVGVAAGGVIGFFAGGPVGFLAGLVTNVVWYTCTHRLVLMPEEILARIYGWAETACPAIGCVAGGILAILSLH